jgi:hypothetical protein
VVTRPSIADPGEPRHVCVERIASIPLRSVAGGWCSPFMILRGAALATLWVTCTAGLFLVLDLYT